MAKKTIREFIQNFDSEEAISFGEKKSFTEDDFWVHTNSPILDYNLGVLGYPVGITEISGMSKSGKTTMALAGMKHFQKNNPDGLCIILSSENRDNKLYAEEMGIDTDDVLLVKTKFVEDMFLRLQIILNDFQEFCEKEGIGKPKIFIMWDSLGATLSRAEAETFQANAEIARKNAEKGTDTKYKHAKMGSFASSAKQSVKAILAQIYEKDIVFIVLNHRYEKIGSTVGGTKSTGGRWIEFLPTLRLELVRIGWIKVDDEEVGQTTLVKVEKNDFGSRRRTEIEILLGKGLVLTDEDIDYAIDKGIIKPEKKTIRTFGKLRWSSKRTFYDLYQNHPKMMDVLHKKIANERHKDVLEEKGIE